MAKIIDTSTVNPKDLSPWEREQVYNGMDCCITSEVMDCLLPQFDNITGNTYAQSLAWQGPALEMRLRGVRVDNRRRGEVIEEFYGHLQRLEDQLERIVFEGVGLPTFKWTSNPDVARLLYDVIGIPPPRGKRSVDRTTLERLDTYIVARQIIRHLLVMRDIDKKIKVLKTELDPDGRIRTSYNIAGTNTGRFSSSFSEFGTGGNLQNIEESLRSMFIADEGCKFAKFDGAQIQSRIVGAVEWNLFHDGTYLDACETGDLHTTVATMTWPELPWTGDLKKDRAIANEPFYRHHTRRDMCKKNGHATNFDGKPDTVATQSRVPITLVIEFQRAYFKAFPAHRRWREWTARELRRTGTIVALDGRKRQFWGRRNDDDTVREALAYDAQSTEAYIMNTGMLNIWRSRIADVMMHDHDALTVQYPEHLEDKIIPKLLDLLKVPIELNHNRTLLVPFDCKTGWNRGDYDKQNNPDGLKEYRPGDKRRRTPEVPILDRPIRLAHG